MQGQFFSGVQLHKNPAEGLFCSKFACRNTDMKKALLQMHVAVMLWGFTGVLGRAISLDAPVLVWYRMLLTAVFVAVILFYRKEWVRVTREDMGTLTLVGFLMGIHWVAFYGAIKFSNASIALVCLSTSPIFTTIFNQLIERTKYKMKELLLGLMAIAGMALIYRFQQLYGLGILMGVIAALLASVFTIINKKIAHKYPARTMVFYEMGTGWVFVTLLLPLQFMYRPDTHIVPQNRDWLWLVLLSLCCTVWAQSLALNALKHISSFTATLTVNLEPVYGIILAFLIFHENKDLNWGFFAGMGLICLSVIVQMLDLLKPGGGSPGYIEERGGIES
jgi:drug/metabolite transporter (DMT)-like permease